MSPMLTLHRAAGSDTWNAPALLDSRSNGKSERWDKKKATGLFGATRARITRGGVSPVATRLRVSALGEELTPAIALMTAEGG